jgi:hypothetical protein
MGRGSAPARTEKSKPSIANERFIAPSTDIGRSSAAIRTVVEEVNEQKKSGGAKGAAALFGFDETP